MDVIVFACVGAFMAFLGAWLIIVADQPRSGTADEFREAFKSALIAAGVMTPTAIMMGIVIINESQTKLADTVVASAVFVSVGLLIGVVHVSTSALRLWSWIIAAGIAVDYALLTLVWLHIGVTRGWIFATPGHFLGAATTAVVLATVTGLLLSVFAVIHMRRGKEENNFGPRERHERATAVLLVVVCAALLLTLGSFPTRASTSLLELEAQRVLMAPHNLRGDTDGAHAVAVLVQPGRVHLRRPPIARIRARGEWGRAAARNASSRNKRRGDRSVFRRHADHVRDND